MPSIQPKEEKVKGSKLEERFDRRLEELGIVRHLRLSGLRPVKDPPDKPSGGFKSDTEFLHMLSTADLLDGGQNAQYTCATCGLRINTPQKGRSNGGGGGGGEN